MYNPTLSGIRAQSQNLSEDEDEADEEADEEAEEEPVKATAPQTAPAFVICEDGDDKATQQGVEKASAPKRAPLGPKRMPSFMPSSNLKRDRDESDDQDSECSDEENDENKDSWVPSKKRRISGYYGANDDKAPIVSASQMRTTVSMNMKSMSRARTVPFCLFPKDPVPKSAKTRRSKRFSPSSRNPLLALPSLRGVPPSRFT
ncbi:hypothetical protein FA13DRAFT_1013572 [Coprinellus micaceus]|uniref:Uncharacterized protein n=1 Tax=Coprinellus micaceus TaxID=71717 RepID=A0A4Y7RNU8_COPMI|nr:hypothetical protein FA13DRAFT_1013572 [Coprinellus micaceus]